MAKAVGIRLRAAGLRTRILFPECHDANTSWQFIEETVNDAELWPFVGMIGYLGDGLDITRPLRIPGGCDRRP